MEQNIHAYDGNSDVLCLGIRAEWEVRRVVTPDPPTYADPSSHSRYLLEHRERGRRETKQLYLVATQPPQQLQQFGFQEVEYIVFQVHQTPTPPTTGDVWITWTDAITGDQGRTYLDTHAFVVLPNPMPYDPVTGAGGILLESAVAESVGIVAFVVGRE